MTANGPTIAALLTPLAPGAIAVIGVAGPDVDAVLDLILRRPESDRPPEIAEDQPTFCRLVDRGEVLDDVVVVRTRRGDVAAAELNTHGGVRIAQRALVLLKESGARIVDAGVFASRFAIAGEIEQDVDRALLGVSSRRVTRWLLRQRTILPPYLKRLGSRRMRPKTPGVPPPRRSAHRRDARAPDVSRDVAGCTLSSDEAAAFCERSRVAIRLIEGLRVALIGPPNSGKSTLANRLIGTDRVITSDQIGTTRDWVSETALIRGWPIVLTDTAGIRDTECEIEAEAINRAREQAGLADLIVVVLDATSPPETQRVELEAAFAAIPVSCPRIVVLNKCDIAIADCGLHNTGAAPALPGCPLCVSALTGAGVDALESRLECALGLDLLDDSKPTAFLPHQLAQ